MQILIRNEYGYSYLGNDHNYYVVIDNSECNALNDVYPMTLGPFQAYERCYEVPF